MSGEPGDQSRLDAGRHALDHDTDVACPRCGYSQRGVIESWREACPLDGRCAECGLTFTWSELLRPRLHARWCVEYAPRRRRWLPPSIRSTIFRSMWPWAPRELYRYLLLVQGDGPGLASVPLFRLAVVGTTASLGLFVLMPIGFVLLPISRRKAKVRWSHVVRVKAYGLLIPVVLVLAGIVVTGAALLTAFDSSGSRTIAVALAMLAGLPVPLVALWWAAAIRNYLKMPHAWALTGMLTVMNLLLLIGLLWLVNPDLAGDICAMVS